MKGYKISFGILVLLLLLNFNELLGQLRVGASQRIITPTDTAYIAGHSHDRIFSGVNDDIYVKAVVFSNNDEYAALLTFDCIGLLYPQLLQIRTGVQEVLPDFPVDHIIMSSTHTHSGPDVVGLWGPNIMTSGVDQSYMTKLVNLSIEAIVQAYQSQQVAVGEYAHGLHGDEWVYNISEPEEIDRSIDVIRFKNNDGQVITTLTNFACHPTFLDAVNDKVSSDYVGGFYQTMDSLNNGVNLFLQGSIGGWVQPEYEEKTHHQAFFRGDELANKVDFLLQTATPLKSNKLSFRSAIIEMPVANDNFRLLSQMGVVNRSFGETVTTEIAYFQIGEAAFATHPGETVPEMSHRTKSLMQNNGPKMVMGLGMDALGYILKPYFFDKEKKVPHSEYLCSVSVGPAAMDVIMNTLNQLIPKPPTKDSLITSIDHIIEEGIDSMAFPGCQILIAHKGEVILEKAYGFHTYEQIRSVKLTDLYDLASVTKVSSGLPILMKLYGEGLFDLDAPFSKYYDEIKGSDKANLSYREMLSHQAGLEPYIVYWKNTLRKNGKYRIRTFKTKQSKRFNIQIADQLYMHRKYHKKMEKAIKKSKLSDQRSYIYSGLLFQLMPEIIENIVHVEFETYLNEFIFKPLEINRLLYNPLRKYQLDEIVPTELDTIFRHQLVRGHVHDEAAAMLNGISCNAGLFSNAHDLGKLFLMYLNEGKYKGKQIISADAINEFTRYQYPENGNRRGLGFDKPLLEYVAEDSYIAKSASPGSFGHSGFTGTFVWADPENDILVVFLSNRVYPTRDNRKLYSLNIRPRLHQAIYDALEVKE